MYKSYHKVLSAGMLPGASMRECKLVQKWSTTRGDRYGEGLNDPGIGVDIAMAGFLP
jgi:hypothetical protein